MSFSAPFLDYLQLAVTANDLRALRKIARRNIRCVCVAAGLVAVAGCLKSDPREVYIACEWVMYGNELDSFVFDLDRREVYWVNEDKRYPITEFTEGRIGFTGRRSTLRVSERDTLRDVSITFSINRVTGELYVRGINVPPGYRRDCTELAKIL